MEITAQELLQAWPKLIQMNPLAQAQLVNIVLAERLAASQAEVAALTAKMLGQSPNGQPAEPTPIEAGKR